MNVETICGCEDCGCNLAPRFFVNKSYPRKCEACIGALRRKCLSNLTARLACRSKIMARYQAIAMQPQVYKEMRK